MYFLLFVVFYLFFYIWNRVVSLKYRFLFWRKKTIRLGTLTVDEITILEWKPLFSLKTFYFHRGEAQEIFHTHSFSAFSFLLYGNYMESFFDPIKPLDCQTWEEPRNRSRWIYIPKERFHQITKSEGCRTIMITGPWGNSYREYKPSTNELIISTHGRKEVKREVLNFIN
jgi:hypothetical protein